MLSRLKNIAWPTFIVYMALLVKLILLKEPHYFLSEVKHFGLHNIKAGERNLNFVPFRTTLALLSGERTLWEVIENIGGNIIGFIPMGILLPLLFVKLNNAKKVIFTVFLISLAFETTQFIVGVGYCDVDDLILNTLGGAMGWCMYKKWFRHPYSINTNAAQE